MDKHQTNDSGTPRFPLGQLVATPAALRLLAAHGTTPQVFLRRHMTGDFGDLPASDQQANEAALRTGGRIFSAYTLGSDRLWVITEASRESTCVLCPEDY